MSVQDYTEFSLFNPNGLIASVSAASVTWDGQTHDSGATKLYKAISPITGDYTASFQLDAITAGGFRGATLFALSDSTASPSSTASGNNNHFVGCYWDGSKIRFSVGEYVDGVRTQAETIDNGSATATVDDYTLTVTLEGTTLTLVVTSTGTYTDTVSIEVTPGFSFDTLFAFASSVNSSSTNPWSGELSNLDFEDQGGPTVFITSGNLTPGGNFSLSYSNYPSAPVSPVTITDSNDNSITVPVTVTDNGDGTGTATGTMPALPSSGSVAGLLFGNVTLELGT